MFLNFLKAHTCMSCINNELFFFERCSLITVTVCAYKLNNAHYEYLFAPTVEVIRLHLSKKTNPLFMFIFLYYFLQRIFNYFNRNALSFGYITIN